jgi:divalent metal cation (Fe/Co/Zn/Cd) transporter
MWRKDDPLGTYSLIAPQPSEEARSVKNSEKNPTTYECVSCLDDVLFPPKKKLLPAQLRKLSTLAILLCAFTLVVAMSLTGISYATYTDSKSCGIFAFAFDALLQAVSSLLLIWRFSVFTSVSSEQKETVTTLGVAFVNAVSAISIIVPTVDVVIRKEKATHARVSLIVAAIGMILYAVLFFLKFKVSRKLGSSSLMTDAIDSLGGALLGLSVLISSLILMFTRKLWFLDAIIALGIAALMFLYAAAVLVKQIIMWRNTKSEELI